jgi:ferredoxin
VGKVTGFLEIDRKEASYVEPKERLKNYREFTKPLAEPELKDQAARCMDCGIPYCHNGCPVNNIIPDWNDLVYNGDWKSALEVLHSTNNFPEFTGRICPAPCEASCTLNIDDAPVAIKSIECRKLRTRKPENLWPLWALVRRAWLVRSNWRGRGIVSRCLKKMTVWAGCFAMVFLISKWKNI